MTSQIDPTVPVYGTPTTASVRANFQTAHDEISALQSAIPLASATPPLMAGSASPGSSVAWSRGDHQHPSDTTKVSVSAASATLPTMDATASAGSAATYSRGDHTHPSDTSKVSKAGDTMTGLLTLSTGVPGNNSLVTSGTAAIGGNVQATGDVHAKNVYADAAGQMSTTGLIQGGSIISTGNLQANGVTSFNGALQVNASSAFAFSININNAGASVGFNNAAGANQGYCGWTGSDIRLQSTVANTYLTLDGSGNFVYVGGSGYAAKKGGGAWGDTSDVRIKDVLGDYTLGLDEVLRLHVVSYVYKGNDTRLPDEPSPHALAVGETDQPLFVGLIAQEVEPIFPSMVKQHAGYIDGVAVTDLRSLDTSELMFALVNAVKTIAARLDALEAAL